MDPPPPPINLPVGLAYARWSPDGRHILAASEMALRITIWSLLDRTVGAKKESNSGIWGEWGVAYGGNGYIFEKPHCSHPSPMLPTCHNSHFDHISSNLSPQRCDFSLLPISPHLSPPPPTPPHPKCARGHCSFFSDTPNSAPRVTHPAPPFL